MAKKVVRKHQRQRMRRAAWIKVREGEPLRQCVLWDLSEQGAKLTAQHASVLPDTFAVVLAKDGDPDHFCRVVWRKGPYIGVRFVDAAEARRLLDAPPERKTQSISPYWKHDYSSAPMRDRNAAAPARNYLDTRKTANKPPTRPNPN